MNSFLFLLSLIFMNCTANDLMYLENLYFDIQFNVPFIDRNRPEHSLFVYCQFSLFKQKLRIIFHQRFLYSNNNIWEGFINPRSLHIIMLYIYVWTFRETNEKFRSFLKFMWTEGDYWFIIHFSIEHLLL
jgi:hypothetical protein